MMYWKISEPLSYNALFNFIVGERGNGKTYGCKEYGINKVKKKGCQFGYIRRYDKELEKALPTFFNDIEEKFPEDIFKTKGLELLMNEEVIGYGFCLSTAGKLKSMSFPKIDFLIFDEFILDPANYHQRYLPDEVQTFLNLYETIARSRSVPIFFIGNRLSDINPYFLYFDIKKPESKNGISCKNDILVQFTDCEEYREMKRNTRFGKIIEKTEYAKYSINNESLRDTNDFIENAPTDATYVFTLKTLNADIGVYYSNMLKAMYCSTKVDLTHKIMLTTETTLHGRGCTLVTSKNSVFVFRTLVEGYKRGEVLFSSLKVKTIVMENIRGMLR